jgi:hypothetical protein
VGRQWQHVLASISEALERDGLDWDVAEEFVWRLQLGFTIRGCEDSGLDAHSVSLSRSAKRTRLQRLNKGRADRRAQFVESVDQQRAATGRREISRRIFTQRL